MKSMRRFSKAAFAVAAFMTSLLLPFNSAHADSNSIGEIADLPFGTHGGVCYEGHEYLVVNDSLSWEKAEEYCETQGGHLVTITSQEEKDFVVKLVESNDTIKNCYWIGLKRNDIGSVWRWVTGEKFDYTNWAPNEPNNDKGQGEYYVHLFGVKYTGGRGIKMPGDWNDVTNTGAAASGQFYAQDNFGFICEWGDDVESYGDVDKNIKKGANDEDLKNSKFNLLQAKITETTDSTLKITWNPVSGADGYLIYGNFCGKKYGYEYMLDIEGGKTNNYLMTGLNSSTYYKYFVVAYKQNGDDKKIITISKTLHCTTTGGNYGNPESVKITKVGTKKNPGSVTLKKGKSAKITAKVTKVTNKVKTHRKLAYESSNTKVATVTSSGKIVAKKKGKCEIYVYAQNGVCAKLKVVVK